MVGLLILGVALIYLFPAIFNILICSDRTTLWLTTLAKSGYSPTLGIKVGGIALAIEIVANWI
jgi:hypothetical protein